MTEQSGDIFVVGRVPHDDGHVPRSSHYPVFVEVQSGHRPPVAKQFVHAAPTARTPHPKRLVYGAGHESAPCQLHTQHGVHMTLQKRQTHIGVIIQGKPRDSIRCDQATGMIKP